MTHPSEELMTTGQVADLLDIPHWRLNDLIIRRKLPKPKMLGNRRVWTAKEIAYIRVVLDRQKNG